MRLPTILSVLAPAAVSAAANVDLGAFMNDWSARLQHSFSHGSAWLQQSFYHASLVPLLLATGILAYLARPSTTKDLPDGFRRFEFVFLSVWTVCVSADWLQGPFVYALYEDYGFNRNDIAELFVAGFGSSLIFGCLVGNFADKFGRKLSCILYCVLYIISCVTMHFKHYMILMFGRMVGGIATSLLFSCFECWMVSEHSQRHKFSGGLLDYMFGQMFTAMYLVAIASGLVGQAVADAAELRLVAGSGIVHIGGKCGPFDLAIACLFVGILLICALFEENYGQHGAHAAESEGKATPLRFGDPGPSFIDNILSSAKSVFLDRRILLLGIVISMFEGSMYTFVFNWTPALDSDIAQPPHGVIFSLFMMACMCGASASTLLGATMPARRLMATLCLGLAAFALSAHSAAHEHHLRTCFAAFLLFEFCVGVYFPSVGVLKSDIVPEQVRGTIYNLYRVPLNAIVIGMLLSRMSIVASFQLCAVFLLVALGCIMLIARPAEADSGFRRILGKLQIGEAEKGIASYGSFAGGLGKDQPVDVAYRPKVHDGGDAGCSPTGGA